MCIYSIIISINPFKQLPIYGYSLIQAWMTADPAQRQIMTPHLYSIPSKALSGLRDTNRDQSVLISGDSGAGKTEATKLILRFLGEVAGGDTGAENRILQSTPVLESFGNSKTMRNNNSRYTMITPPFFKVLIQLAHEYTIYFLVALVFIVASGNGLKLVLIKMPKYVVEES